MRVRVEVNPFIPELHLFHSREKYQRFCVREFGGHEDLGTDAQTTYDHHVAAVLFDPTCDRRDLASDFALLAHEAYHVACCQMEALGETQCGEEVMAYMIQVIVGSLCVAHQDWMEKHGRGPRLD